MALHAVPLSYEDDGYLTVGIYICRRRAITLEQASVLTKTTADDSKFAAVDVDLDEGPFSQARRTQHRWGKRSKPGEWGGVHC